MPVFNRKYLRQTLGQDYIGDTEVSTTTGSHGAVGSVYLIDSTTANLAFSGQGEHARSHLRVNGMDLRVASFNAGSGAFVTLQSAPTVVPTGAEYEEHKLLSPDHKDRAINRALERLRIRREVTLQSVKDLRFYDVETAGTPDRIVKVIGAYYFGDPTNSLSRSQKHFDHAEVVLTGSGTRELRITPSLDGSAQIVLDALVQATLGAADTATLSIPDERWLLFGAEVECWTRLVKDAPGKDADAYKELRRTAARRFTKLSAAYAPQFDRKVGFEEPF